MSALYVIGNGFDSAHNLKTSYWFFREYLKKYAENFYIRLEENYGFYQIDIDDYHNGPNPQKALKRRDEYVYDVFWKTIEEKLGYVNEASMLDFSQSIVDALDLESGPVGIQDTLDDYWEEQYSFINELQDYVFKWAKQIRLNKCIPLCNELVENKDDIFLNFNYTNTLEKVYNIPPSNVLHIHGGLPPYCGIKPILGHGNYDAIKKCKKQIENAERVFDEASISIYNAIADFYKSTLKDTKKILLFNSGFFNRLANIDTVKVIGHSLGKVDHPYFKKILDSIDKNSEWFVYYYKSEEEYIFEKEMLELGVNKDKLHVLHSNEFWKV